MPNPPEPDRPAKLMAQTGHTVRRAERNGHAYLGCADSDFASVYERVAVPRCRITASRTVDSDTPNASIADRQLPGGRVIAYTVASASAVTAPCVDRSAITRHSCTRCTSGRSASHASRESRSDHVTPQSVTP